MQTIIFFEIYPSPRIQYGLHSLPLIAFGLLAIIEMMRLNSDQKYLRKIFLHNSFAFIIYLVLLLLFEYSLITNPNFDPLKISDTSIYMQIISTFLMIALTIGFLSAVNVRLNKELEDQRIQIIKSEKMASIGLLAAGVAHEINNPINYINGGVIALKKVFKKMKNQLTAYMKFAENFTPDIYDQRLLPNETQINSSIQTSEEMFHTIQEGVIKTAEIVQSIRGFASNTDNVFVEFDVNEKIDSVLLMLSGGYKNRIEIVKEYSADSKITGVPVNIQQIFMNLLSNAIDAISEEGEIWIKTQKNSKQQKLIISIKDSGVGIPENIQHKIFDPFFSSKEVGKGSGLGLYLAHTFIEQHNGTICVKSVPFNGAEFIVELPLNKQPDVILK